MNNYEGDIQKDEKNYDVAIVGYGPVGATLANYLGQHGISVAIFDREESVYHQPRASHLDGEVMRFYQSLGLANEISEITIGSKDYEFLNGEGKVIAELKKPQDIGQHGWNQHSRFHQPVFEELLRKGVKRYQNVSEYLSCEVTTITELEDSVEINIKNRKTKKEFKCKASYVIGCDGAKSTVRKVMEVEQEDLGLHQPWLVIDIKAKQPEKLPAIGIQYCDPSRPTTYVPGIGEPNRFRWEIMIMPTDNKAEIEKEESVWKLLSRWVTPGNAILERASVYTFHSTIATKWKKGRLILAGDSAHQMPPFLGQGMCAGVRDVSNLGWKLVRVLKGLVNENLLDTYERERKHHVREFIKMSMELGEIITEMDPVKVKRRDTEMLENPPLLKQPSPKLGSGFNEKTKLAGDLLGQPKMENGEWMDDLIGHQFALITRANIINEVSSKTRDQWNNLNLVVIDDQAKEVANWLSEQQVGSIVLRPDRYIYGIANSGQELEKITINLSEKILTTLPVQKS